MSAVSSISAGRRFRLNVAANFIGSGWTACAQLICIPLYVQMLGVEAYGLIGFYVTLRAALLMLDLGLATTVNREMARLSVDRLQVQGLRDLARTLEIGYWILGGALAALLIALAPILASRWVNIHALPLGQVRRTLVVVGMLIGLQWPLSFYQGGLMGLQRQISLNGLRVLDATLSTAGAVFVLRFINRDISVFFEWQICVSALHLILIHDVLWRSIGGTREKGRADWSSLRPIRMFALGMSGISVLGIMLTQMDKIVLSRLLPLTGFGYYMLADTLANGMYLFITPVFGALYPRLVSHAAAEDVSDIGDIYHGGTQLLAVLMLPVAAVLALCPAPVLAVWTGDAESVQRSQRVARTKCRIFHRGCLVDPPAIACGRRFALVCRRCRITSRCRVYRGMGDQPAFGLVGRAAGDFDAACRSFTRCVRRGSTGCSADTHRSAENGGRAAVSRPLLSICIATLNRAAFIGVTLDNLISQLSDNVEIVVLDGGSNDGTQKLLMQYQHACPQLRYVRQDAPGGVDRDFDRAVELASGEYCWLMSDDDVLKIGGLARVEKALERRPSLVIVNAEVRTHDMDRVIVPRRLRFSSDREYGCDEMSRLLEETAVYLTFIGCVIIQRELWLRRKRSDYYGSLFIHVGVIFQDPLPALALVLAEPWITIRMGNAMWTAREFEIWMFKWPALIWSLAAPSDRAKAAVCAREPWREISRLVLFRGKGSYTLDAYNKLLRTRFQSRLGRLTAYLVAVAPGVMVNSVSLFYLQYIRSSKAQGDIGLGVYELRQSGNYWRKWYGTRAVTRHS
jgi:O-antigen/teichoic acid export membrane protein/glycosyltransferase involved in cell wall biosynthesis